MTTWQSTLAVTTGAATTWPTLPSACANTGLADIPTVTVVEFVCPQCRGLAFRVSADATEGCAQLTCLTCGTKSFAADSEDFWEDAQPEPVSCPCAGTTYAAAVGLGLRPDSEVRWVSVGIRCITDGALGVCADWKISYSPSTHLVEAPANRGRT